MMNIVSIILGATLIAAFASSSPNHLNSILSDKMKINPDKRNIPGFILAGCGTYELNTGEEKIIVSGGNYPVGYEANSHCIWTFIANDPHDRILLQCPFLSIKKDYKCNEDFLKLTSGDNTKTICGIDTEVMFESEDNKLLVEFVSGPEESHEGGGFYCHIRAEECGKINEGYVDDTHKYPWKAVVMDSVYNISCGAAIISDEWVITAAQCVQTYSPEDFRVIIGEAGDNNSGNVVTLNVYEIRVNSKYHRVYQDADIALVRCSKIEFPSDNSIAPICLPERDNDYARIFATIVHSVSPVDFTAHATKEVSVLVWQNLLCKPHFDFLTDNMLCVGSPDPLVCLAKHGDSLIYKTKDNHYSIIGIASSTKCFEGPERFTRVSVFVPWIKSTAFSGYGTCNP